MPDDRSRFLSSGPLREHSRSSRPATPRHLLLRWPSPQHATRPTRSSNMTNGEVPNPYLISNLFWSPTSCSRSSGHNQTRQATKCCRLELVQSLIRASLDARLRCLLRQPHLPSPPCSHNVAQLVTLPQPYAKRVHRHDIPQRANTPEATCTAIARITSNPRARHRWSCHR